MTPDNAAYYHAAYIAAAIIYLSYALDVWRRKRKTRARLSALQGPRT